LVARQIEEIKVFSLRKESREAFAREMSQRTGVKIYPVDSAEECFREVDIVLAATSSLVPVIRAEWLNEGVHIGCITSYEIDRAVLDRCHRIVVHTKYQEKPIKNVLSGTEHIPAQYFERGVAPENSPDLADLVVGREPGRTVDTEITCFLNRMGLGLQFAALGALILKKARHFGLGNELPSEWFSEDVHP
jgi:ornithine cyclodeaminase/alanine dehydrogenase-like protein (mu-crystallin family)